MRRLDRRGHSDLLAKMSVFYPKREQDVAGSRRRRRFQGGGLGEGVPEGEGGFQEGIPYLLPHSPG